jgi:hypothetical protein
VEATQASATRKIRSIIADPDELPTAPAAECMAASGRIFARFRPTRAGLRDLGPTEAGLRLPWSLPIWRYRPGVSDEAASGELLLSGSLRDHGWAVGRLPSNGIQGGWNSSASDTQENSSGAGEGFEYVKPNQMKPREVVMEVKGPHLDARWE